jgi:hypothetical protein
MSKVVMVNNQPVIIDYGQFPQLISSDKRINGKLMGNLAHCRPNTGNEKHFLQPQERKVLKQVAKKAKFENMCIAKGDAQAAFKMLGSMNLIKDLSV